MSYTLIRYVLDIFSITLTKRTHFLFTTYLYHVPPTCFGVSHTIFREKLRVADSKTSDFTQPLSIFEKVFASQNTKDTTLFGLQ